MKFITVRIVAIGRVQGVGFRYFVLNSAKPLDLKGYTKNLSTGEVETVVEGPEDKVNLLIKMISEGNMLSTVEKVELEYFEYRNEFKTFEIRK